MLDSELPTTRVGIKLDPTPAGPPGLPIHPPSAGASGPADRPACCACMLRLLRCGLSVVALPRPVQRRGRGALGVTKGRCCPSGCAFRARAPATGIWGALIPSAADLSPRSLSVCRAGPPPSPLTPPPTPAAGPPGLPWSASKFFNH